MDIRSTGAASEAQNKHQLPVVLRLFVICSCLAPCLTALRAYGAYRMDVPSSGWNPLADRLFGDLLENRPVFALLHTSEFFSGKTFLPVSYPPLATVILGVLYATGHPLSAFFTIAVVWLLTACWLVRKQLRKHGIGIYASSLPILLVLVSFPIVGLLQRANIELFVWIFSAAGVWAYLRRQNVTAGVLWGLAGALKLYPLIVLLLLLTRRKPGAIVAGVASFALSTILALAFLGPTLGLAARGALKVVFAYQDIRVSEWSMHELAANHSFFGLVKVAAVLLNRPPGSYLLPYYIIGLVVFVVLFFRRIVRMPEANQLLAVTAFMLLLPPISYFYTLVHLYAPWLVLAFLTLKTERSRTDIPALKTTIFLFMPLFVSFTLLTYGKILVFGGLIQAIALYGLFACAVQYPFAEPIADHKPDPLIRNTPSNVPPPRLESHTAEVTRR